MTLSSALAPHSGARSPGDTGSAEGQVITATPQAAGPRRRSRWRTTRLRVRLRRGVSPDVGAGYPPNRAPITKRPFGMHMVVTRRTPSATGFLMVGRVGLEPTTR